MTKRPGSYSRIRIPELSRGKQMTRQITKNRQTPEAGLWPAVILRGVVEIVENQVVYCLTVEGAEQYN